MSKKENILLDKEDLEIIQATGGRAHVRLPGKIASIFPALRHRNFQLYFGGQLVSLVGTWLQMVGQGFLVFELTHSPFWVGAVTAIGGLPTLFLTTFAGVLIDKVDKKKIIIGTQITQTILAFALGVLVLSGAATIPLVTLIAFLYGISNAIDLPARQAFVVEMVGKEDLASAISINVGTFNSARFVGPAVAGVLIVIVGTGWTFILNALSFIPVIFALFKIHSTPLTKPETDLHPFESLKQGISFVFKHERLLYLTLLGAMTALFAWPYQTLMPDISAEVFHKGAQGLGTLLSAAGAGSLAGAIFTSTQIKRENRGKLIFAGAAIGSIALIFFSFNHIFSLAHILLFLIGLGLIIQVANVNTTVQSLAPDQMRGRVMAVYLTMFVGFMPLGNALAGVVAEHTSSLFMVGLGGTVELAFVSFLYSKGLLG